MSEKKILLLEKSNMIRLILKHSIQNSGFFNIFEASEINEAFDIVRSNQPNIICMSYVYYEIDNKNIFYDLKLLNPNAKIILFSSTPKELIDSQIFNKYNIDYFEKNDYSKIVEIIKTY